MLDQEILYQLIYNEQWKDILNELYRHRKDINNDPMLSLAGKVFEQAFFSKIDSYPLEDEKIGEYLDSLYILHHGNFYKISDVNYKSLIIELVKRKPLLEAANYAAFFPDDPLCKSIVEKAAQQKNKQATEQQTNKLPMNWIEIFNRLFELINDQADTATYFSGPKFINVVRETELYYPDYNQYIDQRNKEGKSTSRKIFFYDILIGLSEDSRKSVLNRILDLLRPFKGPSVDHIEVLMGIRKEGKRPVNITPEPLTTSSHVPKVFISYSWDDDPHKQWVLDLANRMRSDGIDVILDRYHLTAGKSITYFVENAIRSAERIIIVFTPNYKLKADKRAGGVGYEYSIMNMGLYENQTENDKIIPVLRNGNKVESIPDFMQQYIHLDLRNDETFENSYKDLLREIYNEPAIVIPAIGEKPIF